MSNTLHESELYRLALECFADYTITRLARLKAVNADLLAALEQACVAMESASGKNMGAARIVSAPIHVARAAIAKAKETT